MFYEVISIIGNVKNAGKTTVLNTLIEGFLQQTIGLTSIGMDGEKLDTVTFLPKPRIQVYPGFLVATTVDCLQASEAKYRILTETHISTALGKVVIVEILQPGFCLIAGPATISEMETIVKLLQAYGGKKILVDGAFSRQTTSTLADASILCIGANKSRYLNEVVADASWMVRKLTLPSAEEEVRFLENYRFPTLISYAGELEVLDHPSTITHPDEIIQKMQKNHEYLYIPHAVGSTFLRRYIHLLDKISTKLIVQTPISIQIEDELLKYIDLFANRIYVLHPIRLLAICSNPYSPMGYEFDSREMILKLQETIQLPIIDVVKERSESNG